MLNPAYTFTLPRYQMVAGFYDIMSHILEQYFSGEDDNTSDYIMEGNTLVSKGKTTDCIVHMIGQPVGAYTDATHGMTLSAVSMAYYRFLMPYGLAKFKRYAVNVWDVDPAGETDEELAAEGLKQMDSYMKELGLVMSIRELGVTEEMIGGIANGTFVMDGGYKVLTHDEIVQILKESMA